MEMYLYNSVTYLARLWTDRGNYTNYAHVNMGRTCQIYTKSKPLLPDLGLEPRTFYFARTVYVPPGFTPGAPVSSDTLLTCLKSATKVMSVPSACRYSSVMESVSLSASSSSSATCPSRSRTRTRSSEPRAGHSSSSSTSTVHGTEPTPGDLRDPRHTDIPDNSGAETHRAEPRERPEGKRRCFHRLHSTTNSPPS